MKRNIIILSFVGLSGLLLSSCGALLEVPPGPGGPIMGPPGPGLYPAPLISPAPNNVFSPGGGPGGPGGPTVSTPVPGNAPGGGSGGPGGPGGGPGGGSAGPGNGPGGPGGPGGPSAD